MADKPLARRLDDIEEKLDSFINNQDKLLEVMNGFNATIETVSRIEDEVKALDTASMKRKVSEEWIHLAEYCMENDFSAQETMEIMRIFTGDFREDRAKEYGDT